MTHPQRVVLAILVILGFTFVYALMVMAPVLLQVADEFDVTVGETGIVTAAFGVPGALVAVLAGPFSDRYGRKRFLLAGSTLMGLGTLATAMAPSFDLLIASRAIAGTGAALGYSSLYASVADHFAPELRARATALVFSGTTFADIAGVPLAGIIGEATTWRVSLGLVAAIMLGGAVLVALWMPRSSPSADRGIGGLYLMALRNRSALLLLLVGFLAAFSYFSWAAYTVVFFQEVFGLSQSVASLIAVTGGLGLLVGGYLTAWTGHRVGHRRLLILLLVLFGVVIFALTNVSWPLAVAVGLNLLASVIVAMRFVVLTSLVSEQLPSARATLLSLLSAMVRLASIGGAVGGALIDVGGFRALGAVSFVFAVLAAIPAFWVREQGLPHTHTVERVEA